MRFSYISRYTQYISRYTIVGYLSRGSGFQMLSSLPAWLGVSTGTQAGSWARLGAAPSPSHCQCHGWRVRLGVTVTPEPLAVTVTHDDDAGGAESLPQAGGPARQAGSSRPRRACRLQALRVRLRRCQGTDALNPVEAGVGQQEGFGLGIEQGGAQLAGFTSKSEGRVAGDDSKSIRKPSNYYDTIVRYYDRCHTGKQRVFYSPYDTTMTLLWHYYDTIIISIMTSIVTQETIMTLLWPYYDYIMTML